MISTNFAVAFAAASLFSMASAATGTISSSVSSVVSIPTPTASVALNAMTDIGCFNSSTPLEDHGSYTYQTAGNCQPICVLLGKAVMGLVDGSNCYCGDLIPAKDTQIANSTCDTPCNGFDTAMCGGAGVWWISLTGLNHNKVANYDPASSTSAAASSATPVKASDIASTVVVTSVDSATSKPQQKSSGPSKAGIAAGVVVGVVALVAIIAAVVLYLRYRRRREVEDEYRRQAAVNQFVAGGKLHTSNSSMTDSRLDPEFLARRQSNGSIADNEDYSRRILKVTNA